MAKRQDDIGRVVAGLLEVGYQLERARRGHGEGSRLMLLQRIAATDQPRPSSLAAELRLSQSAVTRALHSLQDAGFVSLAEDPHDRRSCLVSLTVAGRAGMNQMAGVARERFAGFVADWDPVEVRQLGDLLDKLAQSIDRRPLGDPVPAGRRWRGHA